MNRNKKTSTEKSVKKSHIFGTIFYLFSWLLNLLNFNSLFKSTNKKKQKKKNNINQTQSLAFLRT